MIVINTALHDSPRPDNTVSALCHLLATLHPALKMGVDHILEMHALHYEPNDISTVNEEGLVGNYSEYTEGLLVVRHTCVLQIKCTDTQKLATGQV